MNISNRSKEARAAFLKVHGNGRELAKLAFETLVLANSYGRDATLTPQYRENVRRMEELQNENEELYKANRQFVPTDGFIVPWTENTGIQDTSEPVEDMDEECGGLNLMGRVRSKAHLALVGTVYHKDTYVVQDTAHMVVWDDQYKYWIDVGQPRIGELPRG